MPSVPKACMDNENMEPILNVPIPELVQRDPSHLIGLRFTKQNKNYGKPFSSCYDAQALAQWIHVNPIDPITRYLFTKSQIQQINKKAGFVRRKNSQRKSRSMRKSSRYNVLNNSRTRLQEATRIKYY